MPEKVCVKCAVSKPTTEFHKSAVGKDGLKAECKACRAVYTKQYREDNAERLKNYQTQYSKDHAEELRKYGKEHYRANKATYIEKSAAWYQRAREEEPVRLILRRVKQRAKQVGIPFALTASDLTIPLTCPVLGIPLVMAEGKGPEAGSISVDRIDSTQGYTPGNVRVISHRANTLKNNATVAELELVLQDMKRLETVVRS